MIYWLFCGLLAFAAYGLGWRDRDLVSTANGNAAGHVDPGQFDKRTIIWRHIMASVYFVLSLPSLVRNGNKRTA